MKTNILLLSLCNDLSKFVSRRLANDMEMYYLDTDALLKYNIGDESNVEKLCGEQYLNKLKKKVLSDISDFDASFIYMPYALFLENDNANKLRRRSNIVYLKLSKADYISVLKKNKNAKEAEVEMLGFDIRDEFLDKNCDICVKLSSPSYEDATFTTKKRIDKYLL